MPRRRTQLRASGAVHQVDGHRAPRLQEDAPGAPEGPASSTVRIDGLRVSREAWARVEALVAQLGRAGIPRAHRSGALDLLLLHPEVAAQVLAGGCRVYRCATCSAWLANARQGMAHQDAQPEHEVQGYLVPPD